MHRKLSVLLLAIHAPLLAQDLNFARDIAPIINANCVACHQPNGAAPFSLTSYAEVRNHARLIAEVTRTRFMPPWLPTDPPRFLAEQRLTDKQIQLIAKWVAQGAPAGELSQLAAIPIARGGWSLGEPDLVIQASQAFPIPAGGGDLYWNFVLAPHLKQSRYVRAVEIRMQNPKLIHHANIIVDRMGSIAQPFAGMDVTVPRNPLDLDGHFLFFKPGSTTFSEPDGFSWRLAPTTTLILNTHIQPSGKSESEQPTIALYFTDKPPTRFPYLLQLENDNALNIPAGTPDFVVGDDFKLPIETQVLAIYPHAHYLGKRLEAFATLPGGLRKWLIRIPAWDPNWQSVYRYADPLVLPAGTIISMRYHFDNSAGNTRNPNHPPKRVQAGNQSTDEMAHLWLQIIPTSPMASRSIYAEAWARHELRKNPSNFAACLTIGSLAMARLEPLTAVQPLHQAVTLSPRDAIAHNLYGTALAATGRNNEASTQFEDALSLQPDFPNARFNLAHAQAQAGKKTEAVQNLQRILAAFPNDAAALNFLGQLTSR